MTAVEWLQKEIKAEVTRFLDGEINKPLLLAFMSIAERQAKEMEKQQIIDAILNNRNITSQITFKDAETYYNETFNK